MSSVKERAEELLVRTQRLAATAQERKFAAQERWHKMEERIAWLEGVATGSDARIKTLEDRLAALEQRVNSPVGGLKR